jgi:hypothetical protein
MKLEQELAVQAVANLHEPKASPVSKPERLKVQPVKASKPKMPEHPKQVHHLLEKLAAPKPTLAEMPLKQAVKPTQITVARLEEANIDSTSIVELAVPSAQPVTEPQPMPEFTANAGVYLPETEGLAEFLEAHNLSTSFEPGEQESDIRDVTEPGQEVGVMSGGENATENTTQLIQFEQPQSLRTELSPQAVHTIQSFSQRFEQLETKDKEEIAATVELLAGNIRHIVELRSAGEQEEALAIEVELAGQVIELLDRLDIEPVEQTVQAFLEVLTRLAAETQTESEELWVEEGTHEQKLGIMYILQKLMKVAGNSQFPHLRLGGLACQFIPIAA